MSDWVYNPQDFRESDFSPIPAGDHRVRVQDVRERKFTSGNNGFEITLEVSGHNSRIWYYLVLNPNDVKGTNQRIGSFFDSFGITDIRLASYQSWVGKVGAARVKHEEYNGNVSAKVHYFIGRSKQDKLPPWRSEQSVEVSIPTSFDPIINDADLPFV